MESGDDNGGVPTYHRMGMSNQDFRSAAKDMIEFVVDYYNSMRGKQAHPSVTPGYMKELLPENAPEAAEKWEDVFRDLDKIAVTGLTHWQSSRFFAFFPCGTSYPSILADILIDCCSCIGFTWSSSPACTELEPIVMDWLAKAIGLPKTFIYDGKGPGCGVIQGTASEATIMTVLAARTKTLKKLAGKYPERSQHDLLSKLVAYCSEYSHSSVERACLIAMVNLQKVPVDADISVRGAALKEIMDRDRAEGKFPFYVCATLGTTDCVSFDNLVEIAEQCDEDMWIHVDAAYAGASFLCPEYRHFMKGVEMVTSFNFNPHKWMSVNFDFSALWVKNSSDLINSFNLNPVYLRHENQHGAIDYRHWQIPLGRRFRSLKLWFVMRIYGVENMRRKIREDIHHAKTLESFVLADNRFQVCFPVHLGLVCFRMVLPHSRNIQETNELNRRLLQRIVDSKDIYMVGSEVHGRFFLRLSTGSVACDHSAVEFAWKTVQKHASALVNEI